MSWAGLFTLTNVVAVLGWVALFFLPRRPLVLSAILYAAVGLLCFAYVLMFAAAFGGLVDPGRVAGTAAPDLTNYSVEGIRSLFMGDSGVVIGWTHYLAFDLFVGLWIARDADGKGFGRLVQAPFLLMTFLAGPIGLLGWLLIRGRGMSRR